MDEDFPKDHIHQRVEGLKVWGEATFQGWIACTHSKSWGHVQRMVCGRGGMWVNFSKNVS